MTSEMTMKPNETNGSAVQAETRPSVIYPPRVDILEQPDKLLLFADLPGVKPDELDVKFENGELSLHGRCAGTHAGSQVQAEYGVGDFYRAFTIGDTIDASKITCELKHGVLTVQLPKAEQVKPRRIAVQAD